MDLTPILGPVATLVTAIGAFPLANLAQRGPENRLRASIASNLTTLEGIEKANLSNKAELASKIEEILERQFQGLAAIEEERLREKVRNWPSLAAAIVVTALVTSPMWFLWKPAGIWGWVGFFGLGAFGALLLLSGLIACFGKDVNEKRLRKLDEKDSESGGVK